MDFLLAILPIAVLICVMTKKRSWPSHISLPFAAALVYFITLVHFRLDPNLVNATVVNGALSALTDTISMGGIANQDASDGARATVLRNGTFTGFTRHTCSQ